MAQQQQQQQQQLWDVGRVPGVGACTGAPAPFQLFADATERAGAGTFASETFRHNMAPTDVSRMFFSRKNVDALQEAIRYRVWVDSSGRHVISRQSDTELGVVMHSIYVQQSRNVQGDAADVLGQVRELNAAVLAWCVPRIVGEADGYLRYRSDVANMPVPMEHGAIVTSKGARQLEFRSFF
jgi:hypothetical protein